MSDPDLDALLPRMSEGVTIRFIPQLRPRALAVEQQLMKKYSFQVLDSDGIREWRIDQDTAGGDPHTVFAAAKELDPELIQMAEVIKSYDPDRFDDDKGDR